MKQRVVARTVCASTILVVASAALAQGLIIYPAKGQSAAQQSTDETACQGWAKQNTGIDPLALANAASQPAPAPAAAPQQPVGGERVRGAARGAAAGAAVGAIAGDAGKGAAAGAVGGTVVGGARQRDKQRQNAASQQAAQQQGQANQNAQNADTQAKLATYNKAYSACLEGKGYTVK
jgi:YmgG-like glycine-zipper protein